MQLSALDWIIGAFLFSGLIQGYRRGMVSELVSVAAWFIAYFGARVYALDIAAFLPLKDSAPGFRYAAGFATAFVVSVFVLTILSNMLKKTIRSVGAGAADTLLGAVVGALKSLMWMLVLTTVLLWTPFKESDWWLDSQFAPQFVRVLFLLKPILPEVLADKISV